MRHHTVYVVLVLITMMVFAHAFEPGTASKRSQNKDNDKPVKTRRSRRAQAQAQETELQIKNYVLQHNLGVDGAWETRTKFSMTFDGRRRSRYRSKKVTVSNLEIGSAQTERFHDLLLNNGLYRVRLLSKNDTNIPSTSTTPCTLVVNDFNEDLVVHLDENNVAFALNYENSPVVNDDHCSKTLKQISLKTSLTTGGERDGTQVQVIVADPAKEQQEEPGMFRKYWYVFAGIAVLTIFR